MVWSAAVGLIADVGQQGESVHVRAITSAQAGKAGHGLEIVELLVVADVQAARIADRLEVPGLEAAGAQGLVDEVALPLVGDHGLVERRRVASAVRLRRGILLSWLEPGLAGCAAARFTRSSGSAARS